VVLNNLATLLAEKPKGRKEAITLVERAMRVAGQQPPLLDTKGMILVHDRRMADAVPWLERAAAAPNADPRYAFHLAVAYHRLGQADKAREWLHKAQDGNLFRQILTDMDRSLLDELVKKLTPNN
jgi:Flp pilus assembly protein TadD